MTLNEYEKRLQAVNPELYIKRYGTSMAGIHTRRVHGPNQSHYICRIPQGEIVENDIWEWADGEADQYITTFNETGKYKWKKLTRRGRRNTAHQLYDKGYVSYQDIAKIC